MFNSIVAHTYGSIDATTGEQIDGQSIVVLQDNDLSYVVALFNDEVEQLINGKYPIYDVKHVPLIEAEYVLLNDDAIPPYKKRPSDVGYDIYSIESGMVPAKGAFNVKTGIAISVKRGHYYTIEGRSGLGIDELVVPFRGILDAGYIGEVKVLLLNFSDKPYYFKKHERIAQIVFHNQIDAKFNKRKKFSKEYNKRGTAGFGSSGK